MKKPVLVWDEWNRKHIKKHSVTVAEAKETYNKSEVIREGKFNTVQIISKVKNGRMLTIFLSYQKQPRPYVVSARDAGRKERRIYEEKKGITL